MKNAPVQHAVEHFLFRRFRAFLLRRSHADVRRLGAKIGGWAFKLLKSPRRKALKNLQRIYPEMAQDERLRIVEACFRHFGSHFCESVSIGRFSDQEMTELFDIEGFEIIEDLLESGRGFFLHTGHYGSFEMAIYPCGLKIPNYHAVVRPLDNPKIHEDLMAVRGRTGARILTKAGVGLKMRGAVKRGQAVAIIIDQHVRPAVGIQVPFLGHPAWTSAMLASLAVRMSAPVVPFTCVPADGGRYRLTFHAPLMADSQKNGAGSSTDERVADLTAQVLRQVENDIHNHPEWWLWMHRRWRD